MVLDVHGGQTFREKGDMSQPSADRCGRIVGFIQSEAEGRGEDVVVEKRVCGETRPE